MKQIVADLSKVAMVAMAAVAALGCSDDGDPLSRKPDGSVASGGGDVDGGADAAVAMADADVPIREDGGAADADAADDLDASADAAPVFTPGALPQRPYLRREDSPFAGVDFVYFHLEDFEDGQLDTPGVSNAGGRKSSSFGPSLIDSVDNDDGVPDDDQCKKPVGTCDAWWGPGRLKFVFDADTLGGLPTHAGVVWTDGEGQVSFEAFGPDGMSLYKLGPVSEPGFPDSTVQSSTREDRFFGVFAPEGISAIEISNTAGGVEADHLQYGRAR